MTTGEQQRRLGTLLRDVLAVDGPDPEVLARYAEDPDSLDPSERQELEEQLARSPAARDQLRVLRQFDFSALDEPVPAPVEAPARPGLLDRLRNLIAPRLAPLAWIAAALLLVALPVGWYALRPERGARIAYAPPARAPERPSPAYAPREPTPEGPRPAYAPPREVPGAEPEVPAETPGHLLAEAPVEEAPAPAASVGEAEVPAPEAPRTEPGELLAETEQPAESRSRVSEPAAPPPARPGPLVASAPPPPATRATPRPAPAAPPPATRATPRPAPAAPPPTGSEPDMVVARVDLPPLPDYAFPAGAAAGFGTLRRSGSLRSAGPALPRVTALVPEHAGRTVQASPQLFWFLSAATDRPLVVTLVDRERERTLLDVTLPGPHPAGIGGLSLASRGAQLPPGRTLQWYVSVLGGDTPGPGDSVAEGGIERVPRGPVLAGELRAAGDSKAAHVYAKNGLWYDALQAVSDRIASHPGDAELRAQRAALLEQVGLDGAAAWDRGR